MKYVVTVNGKSVLGDIIHRYVTILSDVQSVTQMLADDIRVNADGVRVNSDNIANLETVKKHITNYLKDLSYFLKVEKNDEKGG